MRTRPNAEGVKSVSVNRARFATERDKGTEGRGDRKPMFCCTVKGQGDDICFVLFCFFLFS